MSGTAQNRQPAGVPAGGQFAVTAHAEAGVSLGAGDPAPEAGRIPVQTDDDHAPDVERLTALAAELAVAPADLDDAVRDVTDQMASDMVNASDGDLEDAQDEHYGQMDVHASSVNNGGVRSQVGFLVDQLGTSRAEEVIREAAGARTAGVPGTCACDRLPADFQHAWPHARACPAHSPNDCPGCARMSARTQEATPA